MGMQSLGSMTGSICACVLYAMALTLVACASESDAEVAASREALREVLSDDERSRLTATDEAPDAFARLRARQALANQVANERLGHRPRGEARPELSALYEERFRATRNAIVESAPRDTDWEEIDEGLREAGRRYEPSAGR